MGKVNYWYSLGMVNTVSKVPFPPILEEAKHDFKTAAEPVVIAAVPIIYATVVTAETTLMRQKQEHQLNTNILLIIPKPPSGKSRPAVQPIKTFFKHTLLKSN